MVKLTNEIKDFLKTHLAYVATADEKGVPNVVPKGDIAVLDDQTIIFADLYSHQTKKNLKKNPKIAIAVVNPAGYAGYQIKGRASIIERGPAYNALLKQVPEGGQLGHPDAKYAVKIRVDKVLDIGYSDTADQEL